MRMIRTTHAVATAATRPVVSFFAIGTVVTVVEIFPSDVVDLSSGIGDIVGDVMLDIAILFDIVD